MSERGEVEVLLPLARPPANDTERRGLVESAFRAARDLVRPLGGRVLGVVSMARAVAPATLETALKVKFAVEAPESALPHRSSFQVNGLAPARTGQTGR